MRYIALAISLATLVGCQPAPPEQTTAPAPSVEYQSLPNYEHDIIGMQEQYLEPEFWLQRLAQPDALVMTADEIAAFNQRSYAVQDEMVHLSEHPPSSVPQSYTRKLMPSAAYLVTRDSTPAANKQPLNN